MTEKNLIENCMFVHGSIGKFFSSTMAYFSSYLYPRFEHTVMGTYDKAVEYIIKKNQYDRETNKPNLPALIIDPSGDMDLSDPISGGIQFWRFPNLAPGLVPYLFDPIYQDSNVKVTPAFMRFKGELEIIMLLESFSEYCDLRVFMLQIFGGLNRYIKPSWFTSYIVLPDEFVNYRYSNPYTGESYKLDWDSAGATDYLVKSIASTELIVNFNTLPSYRLLGMSDGSNRYGATDKLSEYRLNCNVEYEVELPTWLIMETDYLAEGFDLEIRAGSMYSAYTAFQPPTNRLITEFSWDFGIDSSTNTDIDLYEVQNDTTSTETRVGDFVYSHRYFHIVTSEEADSDDNIEITLPVEVTNNRAILVSSVHGQLHYGDHFIISADGLTLTIISEYVSFNEGDLVEFHYYDRA